MAVTIPTTRGLLSRLSLHQQRFKEVEGRVHQYTYICMHAYLTSPFAANEKLALPGMQPSSSQLPLQIIVLQVACEKATFFISSECYVLFFFFLRKEEIVKRIFRFSN